MKMEKPDRMAAVLNLHLMEHQSVLVSLTVPAGEVDDSRDDAWWLSLVNRVAGTDVAKEVLDTDSGSAQGDSPAWEKAVVSLEGADLRTLGAALIRLADASGAPSSVPAYHLRTAAKIVRGKGDDADLARAAAWIEKSAEEIEQLRRKDETHGR